MLELIRQPWHWSVAGLLIGLIVPALLLLGNKRFGISSTMKHICAATVPANISFFKYDWKKESWSLVFALGVILGAFFAVNLLSDPNDMVIAEKTKVALSEFGITDFSRMLPVEIFNWSNLSNPTGWIFIILGGFLVGFGTRWAGGCTSGHAISGIANLQVPSIIATICFMVGGILCTHFILPLIL